MPVDEVSSGLIFAPREVRLNELDWDEILTGANGAFL
jgi:hypothetical protein